MNVIKTITTEYKSPAKAVSMDFWVELYKSLNLIHCQIVHLCAIARCLDIRHGMSTNVLVLEAKGTFKHLSG